MARRPGYLSRYASCCCDTVWNFDIDTLLFLQAHLSVEAMYIPTVGLLPFIYANPAAVASPVCMMLQTTSLVTRQCLHPRASQSRAKTTQSSAQMARGRMPLRIFLPQEQLMLLRSQAWWNCTVLLPEILSKQGLMVLKFMGHMVTSLTSSSRSPSTTGQVVTALVHPSNRLRREVLHVTTFDSSQPAAHVAPGLQSQLFCCRLLCNVCSANCMQWYPSC